MIESVTAKNFECIPYLETSKIMKNHKNGVIFSKEKPNVIVGKNGTGKSALLSALSLHTLSYYFGTSNFDQNFVNPVREKGLWSKDAGWREDYKFLPGLICNSDKAPALYYRPNHIPGNEASAGHALMSYSKQANEYYDKTRARSSGEQAASLLEKVIDALRGDLSRFKYTWHHWNFERSVVPPRPGIYTGSMQPKANVLIELYSNVAADALPVILMDEPEQSLDAVAELQLWRDIESADCSKVQIIVATHSLYPFMHPEKFNLIEAEPGFIESALRLI